MSAAATAVSRESHPKKAAQVHMIQHLAALAMLLDDDHIETLLLTICRDNDIVPMLFRRDTFTNDDGEFDGHTLFATLNSALWESGRKVLAEAQKAAQIPAGEAGLTTAEGGAAIEHC